MGLIITTAIDDIPGLVTIQEFKDDQRVDYSYEDNKIGDKINAAREDLEELLNRSFALKTYKYTLDGFPDSNSPIELPRPPLVSVTSLKYVDVNGTQQTLSTSNYTVDTTSTPGRVYPSFGNSWPSSYQGNSGIEIVYTAGYTADECPHRIKSAIILMAAELFRNPQITAEKAMSANATIEALIGRLRVY